MQLEHKTKNTRRHLSREDMLLARKLLKQRQKIKRQKQQVTMLQISVLLSKNIENPRAKLMDNIFL